MSLYQLLPLVVVGSTAQFCIELSFCHCLIPMLPASNRYGRTPRCPAALPGAGTGHDRTMAINLYQLLQEWRSLSEIGGFLVNFGFHCLVLHHMMLLSLLDAGLAPSHTSGSPLKSIRALLVTVVF